MYLIKNIYLNYENNNVVVENGLRIAQIDPGRWTVKDSWWGESEVWKGEYAKISEVKGVEGIVKSIFYCSEIMVSDIMDGYKKFTFNVGTPEKDNIEGYIVFISHGRNIDTDAKKIFGRYSDQIVAIIKEGQYLEFSDKRIEVINGMLMLYI